MGGWEFHPLHYVQTEPLHLGDGRMGFVQLTRPHVPARHLWACLVRRMTWSTIGERAPRPEDYQETQTYVGQHLRFTPLFISAIGNPLNPIYHADVGLQLGHLSLDLFQAIYASSVASTALVPGRTAEDASLHETEFLMEAARDSEQLAPTHWAGGFLLRQGLLSDRLGIDSPQALKAQVLELLRWPTVGGKESYGWGWLRLEEQDSGVLDETFLGASKKPLEDDCGSPVIQACSGWALPWPLADADPSWIKTGRQHPTVCRDYHNGRPGKKVTVQPLWSPGTTLSRSLTLSLAIDLVLRVRVVP